MLLISPIRIALSLWGIFLRTLSIVIAVSAFSALVSNASVLSHKKYYTDEFVEKLENFRASATDIRNQSAERESWIKEFLYNEISKGQKLFSYRVARQYLFGKLHLDNNRGYEIEDQYCERYFTNGVGPMKIPDHTKINCEHTWPQSKFNSNESRAFQKVDLHHLFPVDSVANSTRGNNPFGEVYGRPVHDNCDSSQFGSNENSGENSFEPPHFHKGNVARALFYFSIRYKISIDPIQESYLRKWHRQDPVDEFEMWRNDQIETLQGNRNPFIDDETLVNDISNF